MTEARAKTWLDSEIIELMEKEAKAYKHDCQLKRITFSYREMMENVFAVMQTEGLIEDTP